MASRAWHAPIAIYTTAVRADADRQLAAIGIAAAGFLARNGRYPTSVTELVPDFLAKIPRDPWDGESIRMRGLDDGLVVYSVGQNKVDEGGVNDPEQPTWSPDQAFCLGSAYRQRRLEPAEAH